MAANTDASNGLDATPTGNPSVTKDAVATSRTDDATSTASDAHDRFGGDKLDKIAGSDDMKMPTEGESGSPARDRRESKEWDASKVPPSRFQKRSGSIYSTPSSRDAHLDGSERDKSYWEKMKEKGWIKK